MAELPSDFTDTFDLPSFDEWRALVERDFPGDAFDRKLVGKTPEGIDVQPLYTAESAQVLSDAAPGQAPYVRGTRATAGWSIRQRYTAASAERVHTEIADDLGRGVESVTLRLDRAARLGLDPDMDGAEDGDSDGDGAPSVGVDGLSITSAYGLARALGAADLGSTNTTVDAGANPLTSLGLLAAVAERERVTSSEISGNIAGDIAGTLAIDGALPGSLSDAWDHTAAAVAWTRANAPKVRAWSVSSRAWHNGGADCGLELGLAIAGCVDGLRELNARGVSYSDAAAALEIELYVGRDLFMEVAKFRAARLLWYRVLELCGEPDGAADLSLHASCSPRTRTQRDPWVNMLRGTSETFAAIMGGADAITTTPFDDAIGHTDSLSRRVARNTQLVLRAESHLAAVADPAGGSWYVETLTAQLADRAWAVMQAIEAEGGLGAAVVAGTVQTRVATARDTAIAALRKRKTSVTGVSNYANPTETLPEREAIDLDALRAAQATAAVAEREAFSNDAALSAIAEHTARASAGFAQAVIDAIQAGATIGAIGSAVFSGDAATATPIAAWREAAEFEALVDAAEAATNGGANAAVFVAAVGPLPKHTARAGWTHHALHAGGLSTIADGPFDDADAAVAAFTASGATAAVIVAHDGLYPTLTPSLATALRAAGARYVLQAGRPPKPGSDDAYDVTGVDEFLFAGADLHAALTRTASAMFGADANTKEAR